MTFKFFNKIVSYFSDKTCKDIQREISELRAEISAHEVRLDKHGTLLDGHGERLDVHEARLETPDHILNQIERVNNWPQGEVNDACASLINPRKFTHKL